jgi:putative Mg2+ transporter-C (MgtC) family protein
VSGFEASLGDVGRIAFELVAAAVLSGLVGYDRESRNKPAGLRTTILIGVGATLLGHLSVHSQIFSGVDPSRIAAAAVAGIGFLGAGTIIQSRGDIKGLTTAAALWVVTGVGLAMGMGAYLEAVMVTGIVLLVLIPLHALTERKGAEE